MRSFSHRWLAGPLLAVAVLTCGLAALLRAQPPGTPVQPPSTAPPPGASGPPGLGPGMTPARKPGLPATQVSSPLTREGDLLRLSRNVPGDAKPILIDADEISTWNEGGIVVLLLHGQVLVQQSVSQARFQEGIAWVDM